MNKQIQELMTQAGTDTSGKWMGVEHAEKFAELIVKECIEISKKIETDLESSDMFTESNAASNAAGLVAYRIAQNFGVENAMD